jgi:hypothetical protein
MKTLHLVGRATGRAATGRLGRPNQSPSFNAGNVTDDEKFEGCFLLARQWYVQGDFALRIGHVGSVNAPPCAPALRKFSE